MKAFKADTKFSVIAHSTGATVIYHALQRSNFPISKLCSVFTLAGPLKLSPQLFNKEVADLTYDIVSSYDPVRSSHVAHFNFVGGPSDTMVPFF